MRIDNSDFDAVVPAPAGKGGVKKATQSIKPPSSDEQAADGYTREHEDAMPASWWDSNSGTFVPPPDKPPSRRAAAAAQVQVALASLRMRGHEQS